MRYLLDRKSTSVVPVQRRAWDRDLMVYKRDLKFRPVTGHNSSLSQARKRSRLLLCLLRNSRWPMEEVTLQELEPQRCSDSFPASSTHPTPPPAWALHSPFSGNSSVQHGVPVDFMGQPQADKWRRKTSPWSPLASQNLTSAQPEGRWAVLTQCGR